MSFDLDKNADVSRAKPVTLGGKELQVAPLTLRKIIQTAEMLPKLGADDASTAANIETLIEFVMLGLSRTYPALTKEDLLDSETTIPELRAAVDVVIEQAGGKKKESDAGESKATSQQEQLGTSSSPSSALN